VCDHCFDLFSMCAHELIMFFFSLRNCRSETTCDRNSVTINRLVLNLNEPFNFRLTLSYFSTVKPIKLLNVYLNVS
jgi:hypothetical protein